ncbi:type VI secretion system baseplate subunit TssE [Pseudomonas khavaziana]|uniref:type VI secretion system baseplate subunit TssE n=1 Tax=Pseudomonas khavaziana TaxID=2842351 RepID=UPI001C3E1E0A|nr:type VI secretion system baseplate subunit TssE [Pseudomonas khavaziana]MBV4482401.1 type VI secretion system baseplate subunit TssE [Pseudomonas khavaziana]
MPHHNSLFERLEGDASTHTCTVVSVAAHLGRMLSTRAGSVQALPDYGLPDFNDMQLSLHESLTRSRLVIERFIQAYEPRLVNVRVRLLPAAKEPLVLAFAIDAGLVIDGTTQPVVFQARLMDAGQIKVCVDDH